MDLHCSGGGWDISSRSPSDVTAQALAARGMHLDLQRLCVPEHLPGRRVPTDSVGSSNTKLSRGGGADLQSAIGSHILDCKCEQPLLSLPGQEQTAQSGRNWQPCDRGGSRQSDRPLLRLWLPACHA